MFHVEQNLWGVWVIGLTWGGDVKSGEQGPDHFGVLRELLWGLRLVSLSYLSLPLLTLLPLEACSRCLGFLLREPYAIAPRWSRLSLAITD